MNHQAAKPTRKTRDVTFPQNVAQFESMWPKFREWLSGHGSEVLATESPYEVARFTTPEGMGIVTRNANNYIHANHWSGGSASAFIAYRRHDNDWRMVPKTEMLPRDEKYVQRRAIAQRDGWACCYCHAHLKPTTATIEEFLARACGGPTHIANLGLACERCNEAAGHKSVAEKIKFAQAQLDRARRRFVMSDAEAAARLWTLIAGRPAPVHASLWARLKAAWLS